MRRSLTPGSTTCTTCGTTRNYAHANAGATWNRPHRFDKALSSGADAIVIDLEDAVAANDKALAREHIGAWLNAQSDVGERVLVRINDAGTLWFDADLGLVRGSGIRAIMLPKV